MAVAEGSPPSKLPSRLQCPGPEPGPGPFVAPELHRCSEELEAPRPRLCAGSSSASWNRRFIFSS